MMRVDDWKDEVMNGKMRTYDLEGETKRIGGWEMMNGKMSGHDWEDENEKGLMGEWEEMI